MLLILKICAVVVTVGLGILAFDKWIVRPRQAAALPTPEGIANAAGLKVVADSATQRELVAKLQRFEAVTGNVRSVKVALLRQEPNAKLWLIDFSSRVRSLVGANAPHASVDVPLFAILVEFDRAPAWADFVQAAPRQLSPNLPAELAPQLAALHDYRMAIQGNAVIFASQLQTAAIVHSVNAGISPEFHAGMLNSAMKVEVQVALNIINAISDTAPLQRFYEIEGVEVRLPATDIQSLREKLDANQARIAAEQRAVWEKIQRENEQARAAAKRQHEENLEAFRKKTASLKPNKDSETPE